MKKNYYCPPILAGTLGFTNAGAQQKTEKNQLPAKTATAKRKIQRL